MTIPSAKKLSMLLAILFLSGCTALGGMKLYDLYGPSTPRDRQVASLESDSVDYWNDVAPILEQRCVVCHGCYDAPCQLKLSSIEGIERGGTTELVYNPIRPFETDLTRLFEDAHSVAQWREKGFHPVLNEHDQTPAANRKAGVMYQMLQLKSNNPLPQQKLLGEEFELGLDRDNTCPNPEEINEYSMDHPLWGMPYALPGLTQRELNTVLTWLEQGALHTERDQLSLDYQRKVDEWEQFINQDSFKAQLVSRYIYEHIFLANIYFDELKQDRYFRLVRSKTPPGQPIDLISTRRPYDDPGVDRVYYRLQEYTSAIVAKTHMPYALNKDRMKRWNTLFFDRDFTVDKLPTYDPEYVANPFVVFSQIPVTSRYKFMLDGAQFTVMGFIKGPVCRGHVALNVINDHFWVVFAQPNEGQDTLLTEFIRENYDLLNMPAEQGDILRPLSAWRKYSKMQREYLLRRDQFLTHKAAKVLPLNLDLIWDGDGTNDNAALTVFRHFDSATVEKGLHGGKPDTVWVMGYVDVERIHYLLVAGYDVFGNLGHQLLSRLYMDFLRMESESNFLLLLPQETRDQLRAQWYRNADEELLDFLQPTEFEKAHRKPDITYQSNDPMNELLGLMQKKLQSVLPKHRDVSVLKNQKLADKLLKVHEFDGLQITAMPENANVLIETSKGDLYFTLIRNSAHLNMTSMFGEQDNRIPEEDRLIIMRGFVGSYPNTFFKLKEQDAERFVGMVGKASDELSYQKLVDEFGVRRTDNAFWIHSDRVHKAYQLTEPREYGLLDYNRLENR